MVYVGILRFLATTCILIGGTIAAGRLLDPAWQRHLVSLLPVALTSPGEVTATRPTTVPAEVGLVLFALAAGLLAADRFGNFSANWMRYRAAAMALERRLLEFRLAWHRSTLAPERIEDEPLDPAFINDPGQGAPVLQRSPEQQQTLAQLDAVRAFAAATFDLVEQETQEWAKVFRQSQMDFDQYLRLHQGVDRARDPRRRPPAR